MYLVFRMLDVLPKKDKNTKIIFAAFSKSFSVCGYRQLIGYIYPRVDNISFVNGLNCPYKEKKSHCVVLK